MFDVPEISSKFSVVPDSIFVQFVPSKCRITPDLPTKYMLLEDVPQLEYKNPPPKTAARYSSQVFEFG